MASNSFGEILRITSFGESHGIAMGGVIDGFPPGVTIDLDFVQQCLDRRKPGQSKLVSQRREADKIEVLSGIYQNKTTGSPIALLFATATNAASIMAHFPISTGLLMPTTPIAKNMVMPICAAAGVLRHAKHLYVWRRVLLPCIF